MVMVGVLVKAYVAIIFSIVIDENWNANNPRPYHNKTYYAVKWEEKDFYKNIHCQWILRPKRRTDSDLKKTVRKQYWEVLNAKGKKDNL